MLSVCSADVKTDESESLNQGRLTLAVHTEARSLYSGAAVTLMFLAYSLSTHKLQGGLFIDLSLFSASSSVAPFSSAPFFPPFNGLIFLEMCCYYLLCIFEVQITLSQIINFSKSGFISRPMSAPKYSFMFENSAEDHCFLTFLEFFFTVLVENQAKIFMESSFELNSAVSWSCRLNSAALVVL